MGFVILMKYIIHQQEINHNILFTIVMIVMEYALELLKKNLQIVMENVIQN